MNATARTMTDYTPAMFPEPEVLERIDKPSGHLVLGERLYLWRRLQTVDWAYLVETESSVLP